MNNPCRGFFVQVLKAPCHACNYSKSRSPIQSRRLLLIEQKVIKAFVRQVLIDKHLLGFCTAPQQADQVPVLNSQ
uniref:Uncharacterized protein n=1 Tax=Rhizophora mucronata TaxID=61149 RepID=A0A2P2IQ80_RHIMU